MANKTTNLGLVKPTPEEFYDIGVMNANMDIIDEKLGDAVPSVARLCSESADNLTVPLAIVELSTELNSDLYKILNEPTAWICTIFQDEVSTDNRRMQIAVSHQMKGTRCKIAYRIYTYTSWGTWSEVARNMFMNANDTTDAISMPLGQHLNNTEYRFLHSEGLIHLKLTTDNSIPFEINTEFHITIIFKSGATATTIENTVGVYYTGDDCDGGTFTPVANKIYELGIWWNGLSFQGVVRGV